MSLARTWAAKNGTAPNLVHSRAVVEKTDFMATGTITFVEGDIFEIEIPQASYYRPGDAVKLVVYSPIGLMTLNSSVIATSEDALMVLNPPEYQRMNTRRQYPRVDLAANGLIRSIKVTEISELKAFEEPLAISVLNVSLGGIGFAVEEPLPLREQSSIEAYLDVAGGMECKLSISRQQSWNEGTYFGAAFIDLEEHKQNGLRGLILRLQIDDRVEKRRTERMKRSAEESE